MQNNILTNDDICAIMALGNLGDVRKKANRLICILRFSATLCDMQEYKKQQTNLSYGESGDEMRKKKKVKFVPLSKRNRNRAFLYGSLAVISAVVLRSFLFSAIFAAVCALNVYLMMKAKASEEALAEKMAKSEETMGDELSEQERKFMQRYTHSNEKYNDDWVSQRIKQMDEEDALYDYLESEEGEDDE